MASLGVSCDLPSALVRARARQWTPLRQALAERGVGAGSHRRPDETQQEWRSVGSHVTHRRPPRSRPRVHSLTCRQSSRVPGHRCTCWNRGRTPRQKGWRRAGAMRNRLPGGLAKLSTDPVYVVFTKSTIRTGSRTRPVARWQHDSGVRAGGPAPLSSQTAAASGQRATPCVGGGDAGQRGRHTRKKQSAAQDRCESEPGYWIPGDPTTSLPQDDFPVDPSSVACCAVAGRDKNVTFASFALNRPSHLPESLAAVLEKCHSCLE